MKWPERFVIDTLRRVSGENRLHMKLAPTTFMRPLEKFVWSRARNVKMQGNLVFGRFLDMNLVLDLRDTVLTRSLLELGIWEPYETTLIRKTVKKSETAIDLGANVGYYTVILGSIAKRVYAFEPEPHNFALLKKNILLNGLTNVVCENSAVSDRSGYLDLYLARDNFGDHNTWQFEGREKITVPAVSIDEYFRASDEKIDFVKMDIQGGEWAALEGMKRVLEGNKNLKIVTEFWPRALRRKGIDPSDFLRALWRSGFSISMIDEGERTTTLLNEVSIADYQSSPGSFNLLCVRLR